MVPQRNNDFISKNYNTATGGSGSGGMNNSQGRIPPATRNGPNMINAIPNKLTSTFHNDVSFNRSFANTQMRMYNNNQ